MKKSAPIKTLFVDIGGVLLTNGWDHHARRRVAKILIWTGRAGRPAWSDLDTHEEDKLTLDEYLGRVVFYEKRPFTRARVSTFHVRAIEALPGDDRIGSPPQIRVWIEDHRRQQRGTRTECPSHQNLQAGRVWDAFISSCYVTSGNRTRTFSGWRWTSRTPVSRWSILKTRDVCPNREESWDSRHASHRSPVHMRQVRRVWIESRIKTPENCQSIYPDHQRRLVEHQVRALSGWSNR